MPRPYRSIEELRRTFRKQNTSLIESPADELILSLEVVASDFAQSRISGPNALVKFVSFWNDAQKRVEKEEEDLAILAFNLTTELLGRVKNESFIKQKSYEVDGTFFSNWGLGRFYKVISANVLDFIPEQDHAGIRTYLKGPPNYNRAPVLTLGSPGGLVSKGWYRGGGQKIVRKTFHVDMSAASWEFISNLGKLLPLAYVLLASHIPNAVEVGAAAAVVRTILKSIIRLRDVEGEQCIVSGVLGAKADMGRDPTTPEIFDELRKRACLGKPCKFAQRGYECSVTKENVEEILKFLEAKKVIKKSSAISWNVV